MTSKIHDDPAQPRPISDKQRAANQANAHKSTGPRTPEGKKASSLNAVTHGLRSSQVVLSHEDPERFAQRRRDFHAAYQPVDSIEANLLDVFVAASWRLDRSIHNDTAILDRKVGEAFDLFDLDADDHFRDLIRTLPSNPAHVARQLRSCYKGCEWAIIRLQIAVDLLEVRGFWYPSERDQMLNIFGLSTEDIFMNSLAFDIVSAFVSAGWSTETNGDMLRVQALIRTGAPAGMATFEYRHRVDSLAQATKGADPAAAKAALIAILVPEIDRLKRRLGPLRDQSARLRSGAADRAAVDTSAEGQTRMRYEATHRRAYRNALKDLMDYRKSRLENEMNQDGWSADPPPPPPSIAPNEPISALRSQLGEYTILTGTEAVANVKQNKPNLLGPSLHANAKLGRTAGPDHELLKASTPKPSDVRLFVDQVEALMFDFDYDTNQPMP
jgi:hypothetical protein